MDAEQLFTDAFNADLHDQLANVDTPPADWRVSGKRATKANPDPTGEDEQWWRAHGPGMVQNWIDWRRRSKWAVWATPGGNPAIEMDIHATISGMPLKMVIDRVMVVPQAGHLCIVDLKSGTRTPESDLQLGVYRYGLQQVLGVAVDFGAYWMARKGELSEITNLSRFTPGMIETWFTRLKKAIEGGIFIPHLTAMCRACGHRDYCAAYGGPNSHMDPDSSTE